MKSESDTRARTSHADLQALASQRQVSSIQSLFQRQPFWVLVAICIIALIMSMVSDTFMTERNLYNTTRNFAFVGIMALGMTAVIITAGIDLSVGSLMGLCGIAVGLVMQSGLSIWLGFGACIGVALIALSTAAAAQGMKFALVPKAMNNPFFDLARDGCFKAAAELSDVECYYIGPGEHTEMEQIQIVQDLISQGVDGIAVSPSNAPAMGKALRRAREAGIPVMTWDSDLLESDKVNRATYVGTKNYDIGVNLAKLAMKMKPQGGSLCLQTGGAAAANHNERLQGIRDTLSGMGGTTPPGNALAGEKGWKEVAGCPLITDDDSAKAVQGLADILNKYSDLDVFISTGAFTQWSDNAYRQAIAPHRARMDKGELVVVVADTLPMQMQQLMDGASHGQVGQRPFEMGYKAMFVLKDIKAGMKVDDPIYTGLDVCDQANASTCLVQ